MTRDYDERDFELEDRPAGSPEDRATERMDERDEDRGEDDRGRRPRIDSFEKMKVWQEAHALTMKVFAATPKLPAEQQAGLALQMEQAAVSVPKSIAEGFKRRGPRNKAHFYNLAQTSLEGLRYYFILCADLLYLPADAIGDRLEEVARRLGSYTQKILDSRF